MKYLTVHNVCVCTCVARDASSVSKISFVTQKLSKYGIVLLFEVKKYVNGDKKKTK